MVFNGLYKYLDRYGSMLTKFQLKLLIVEKIVAFR